MSIVNAVFRRIFDLLLLPFSGLPYWVGIAVLGCLLSVAMLWVYKKTSNQARIEGVKARIQASIFEIRLYNDDIGAIFRAQWHILRNNVAYFGLSLVPLAWMIIPMILMIGQLNGHYGYRGLEAGTKTLLKVELAEDWREHFAGVDRGGRPPASLVLPAGLAADGPMSWFPADRLLVWRLAVKDAGRYEVGVRMGDEGTPVDKSVDATSRIVRRSPVRHAGAFGDQVLHPTEAPLPSDSVIRRIELAYPENGITMDVANRVWLMFLVSIVFAFVIKDRMGVKI